MHGSAPQDACPSTTDTLACVISREGFSTVKTDVKRDFWATFFDYCRGR